MVETISAGEPHDFLHHDFGMRLEDWSHDKVVDVGVVSQRVMELNISVLVQLIVDLIASHILFLAESGNGTLLVNSIFLFVSF